MPPDGSCHHQLILGPLTSSMIEQSTEHVELKKSTEHVQVKTTCCIRLNFLCEQCSRAQHISQPASD